VPCDRCLLVFTKPASPGRVKTRLIGALTAAEAAELHAAFLADLVARLRGGDFTLRLAWDLVPGEPPPAAPVDGPIACERQVGIDLGERLFHALAGAARDHRFVAAVGSDHPDLQRSTVDSAFAALGDRAESDGAADVVLGPAADGGYYLIALRAAAVDERLFQGVPWSTANVLAATLDRCRAVGLRVALLPEGSDVDTPEDLRRLAERLAGDDLDCPRTRALLAAWDRLAAVPR